MTNYIFEHYLSAEEPTARKIVENLLDWIWVQSMDKEDTINALLLMLDGIGITKHEIIKYLDWD